MFADILHLQSLQLTSLTVDPAGSAGGAAGGSAAGGETFGFPTTTITESASASGNMGAIWNYGASDANDMAALGAKKGMHKTAHDGGTRLTRIGFRVRPRPGTRPHPTRRGWLSQQLTLDVPPAM